MPETDWCQRCFEPEHRCWTCCDGGRIRVTEGDRSDPMFGKTVSCPDCRTGASENAGRDSEETFLRRSRIPSRYAVCRVGTWLPANARPRLAAGTFCAAWPPSKPFLLLSGEKGTGKTHLACGIAHEVWERHGKVAAFWNVQTLLERYKASFDDDTATETEDQINRALDASPLLILDDFGAHQETKWSGPLLYRIIDTRYANGLPLVMTTNAKLTEMPSRIISRMSDSQISELVQFTGSDQRMQR